MIALRFLWVNDMGVNIQFLPKHKKNLVATSSRMQKKDYFRAIALNYGFEYFDGSRDYGYGGYHYDGRWVAIAEKLISYYDLKPGDKVLDVGCAKGFLLYDLKLVCPGLEVYGLDISPYAVQHSHPALKGAIEVGNAHSLPFPDSSFDLVLSLNTLHNLELEECRNALKEIQRVTISNAFVQVDSYRTDAELIAFERWMLTAKTYFDPQGWLNFFAEAGYTGDYDWTIVEA